MIIRSTLALCLLAAPAFAETCPLSYETFEISVPHTDMEACPAAVQADNAYCRLVINAEVATIYTFDQETDCIRESRSFFEDEFDISFK